MQSINEEYRSTAEELETSKEELQSINEELQTVNDELKTKLESVSRAHSDIQNLMAATDVGILFLDSQLRIKRFTPPIADLFNVVPGDEGRSITDFTHTLDYNGFADGRPERCFAARSDRARGAEPKTGWRLMRMSPTGRSKTRSKASSSPSSTSATGGARKTRCATAKRASARSSTA